MINLSEVVLSFILFDVFLVLFDAIISIGLTHFFDTCRYSGEHPKPTGPYVKTRTTCYKP